MLIVGEKIKNVCIKYVCKFGFFLLYFDVMVELYCSIKI